MGGVTGRSCKEEQQVGIAEEASLGGVGGRSRCVESLVGVAGAESLGMGLGRTGEGGWGLLDVPSFPAFPTPISGVPTPHLVPVLESCPFYALFLVVWGCSVLHIAAPPRNQACSGV